jgi:hypothetical protein
MIHHLRDLQHDENITRFLHPEVLVVRLPMIIQLDHGELVTVVVSCRCVTPLRLMDMHHAMLCHQ